MSRLEVGLKSAARAILPVLVAVGGLLAEGGVQSWRDLIKPANVGIMLTALGVKGLAAAGSAKSVDVK